MLWRCSERYVCLRGGALQRNDHRSLIKYYTLLSQVVSTLKALVKSDNSFVDRATAMLRARSRGLATLAKLEKCRGHGDSDAAVQTLKQEILATA